MRQALTFSATIRSDRGRYENDNGHNHPGAADDIGRRDIGPDSDQPGASGAVEQLAIVWAINRLGGRQNAFGRSISAIHQRSGSFGGVLDRFPGFGIRDFLNPRHRKSTPRNRRRRRSPSSRFAVTPQGMAAEALSQI
jgi:hypothetical protein